MPRRRCRRFYFPQRDPELALDVHPLICLQRKTSCHHRGSSCTIMERGGNKGLAIWAQLGTRGRGSNGRRTSARRYPVCMAVQPPSDLNSLLLSQVLIPNTNLIPPTLHLSVCLQRPRLGTDVLQRCPGCRCLMFHVFTTFKTLDKQLLTS